MEDEPILRRSIRIGQAKVKAWIFRLRLAMLLASIDIDKVSSGNRQIEG